MSRRRNDLSKAWLSGRQAARKDCFDALALIAEMEQDPVRKEAFVDAAMAALTLGVISDGMGWPQLVESC